jgi:hypothetical protein
MDTPDNPEKAGSDAKLETISHAPAAEDFMPVAGPLKEQVERQIAFLTQAVVESAVLASGLFDIHEEEVPNAWAKSGAKPYQRRTRVEEMEIAAKLARASASLVSALARSQRYLEPHYTYDQIIKTGPDGKPAGRVTRIVARLPHKAAGDEPAPRKKKKKKTGGSNGAG